MHLEVGNKSNFIYINSKDIVDFNNNKSSSKQIYKYKIHSYTHHFHHVSSVYASHGAYLQVELSDLTA